MKFRMFFRFIMIVLLASTTISILFHRLMWNQIPTQISAEMVYFVLACNITALVLLVVRPSALGLSTKTDKN